MALALSEPKLIAEMLNSDAEYGWLHCGPPISTPVSYTHLDVYKRQVEGCEFHLDNLRSGAPGRLALGSREMKTFVASP